MNRDIPSLDGLRAISITFVIISHLLISDHQVRSPAIRVAASLLGNGDLGVAIFFGISGFLITSLLKNEEHKTGKIDLAAFYMRRSFRIFPAFYCYLLILLILGVLGVVELVTETWISAATYFRNYWPPFEGSGDWFTAHAWSLSVEEQFYLFWPFCFALLGQRRAAWLAVTMIFFFPVSRLMSYAFLPSLRANLGYMTHTNGDSLMVGCLAALFIEDARFRKALHRTFEWHLPFLAIPFLMITSPLLHKRFGGVYMLPVGYSLEAVAIVITLLWLVERPRTALGRLMNSKLLSHVGTISYSLYLWQQLFTHVMPPWWSVPTTVLAAETSYWFVERPCLSLRDRFLHRYND